MSNKHDRRKLVRLKLKRERRERNRSLYAERQEKGINNKSKRYKLKQKRNRKVGGVKHSNGSCGNIGCKKCNPRGN